MRSNHRITIASAVLLALTAVGAHAEDAAVKPPGLPAGVDWTFNLDAAAGAFGFANSLYTNPKPDEPSGDLGDNWMEASIKPAFGGVYTTSSSAQIYGKISAVGERTFGASPSLVGGDASSFGIEDLYIGWRSGKSLENLGEDALDFTVGRTQYKLGHGLLLWDGASEGGSRGGYWSNVRKAFDFAAIGRLHTGNNRLEVFYLDKDELPESDSHTKLTGVNYEYAIGEDTTLGATYIKLSADPSMRPERDGMNVYNLRAYTAPFSNLKALSFEAEYAKEDNGNAIDSEAWNVQVAWQFQSSWMPKLSYRYAFFQGDDPTTSKNEAFDGLLTGFYDWGTWWQGEIAGEYFVSNSNLITNQLRLHTKPTENIGTGLMFFDFKLDNAASAGVTSKDVATELDWYMDWTVNPHFIVSFVAAVADPGKAVEQSSGRTDTFVYGMIYAAYSF
jgi:hypothetical protein